MHASQVSSLVARGFKEDNPGAIGNYRPTLVAGSIVPGAVYIILGLILAFHVARTRSRSLYWGFCLPVGSILTAVGFFLRLPYRNQLDSTILYILQTLLILVAPAAFLAFNYILYGKLMMALSAIDPKDPALKEQKKRELKSPYSFIPPRIVGRLFVWSDILTFLLQCFGGGLSANASTNNLGTYIVLVGVIAQGVSYAIFLVLLTYSNIRLNKVIGSQTYGLMPQFRSLAKGGHPTARIYMTLYLSSIGIMVRSVFRAVEMAGGYDSYLASTEGYLLLLDALPLALAIGVFTVWWPTASLDRTLEAARESQHSVGLKQVTPVESDKSLA